MARLRQTIGFAEAHVTLFADLATHFRDRTPLADEQFMRNVVDVLYLAQLSTTGPSKEPACK